MFYYTFSVINTMFFPCTGAAVWQQSSSSNIKTVHNSIEHFFWNPSDFFSDDVPSCLWIVFKLYISGTPPENSPAVWDLGNKMARGYRFDVKWVCSMGSYAWGIHFSVLFEKWGVSHFSNRILDYLRHNFPWDRHISRKTDNLYPSYSQDLNPPERG